MMVDDTTRIVASTASCVRVSWGGRLLKWFGTFTVCSRRTAVVTAPLIVDVWAGESKTKSEASQDSSTDHQGLTEWRGVKPRVAVDTTSRNVPFVRSLGLSLLCGGGIPDSPTQDVARQSKVVDRAQKRALLHQRKKQKGVRAEPVGSCCSVAGAVITSTSPLVFLQRDHWRSDIVKFSAQLAEGGLVIRDIKGDGNCMFRVRFSFRMRAVPTLQGCRTHAQTHVRPVRFVPDCLKLTCECMSSPGCC